MQDHPTVPSKKHGMRKNLYALVTLKCGFPMLQESSSKQSELMSDHPGKEARVPHQMMQSHYLRDPR